MKKMLPLLFLLFLGPKLWAQEYRTVHCTDECEFVVHDTLYFYHQEENGTWAKKVDANASMGLMRFGEVLSLDTTDFRGVYELSIPDFQDTDIYNLTRFYAYTRYWRCGGGSGSRLDTLYWDYDVTGWLSGLIRCKEHGRFDNAKPMDKETVEDIHVDIFPVPVSEVLNLHFSGPFSGHLSLLSLVGVEEISIPIHEKEILQVDVQSLSGTYVLVLYDGVGKLMRREKILIL